jgi:hypothetical protein
MLYCVQVALPGGVAGKCVHGPADFLSACNAANLEPEISSLNGSQPRGAFEEPPEDPQRSAGMLYLASWLHVMLAAAATFGYGRNWNTDTCIF